MLTSTEPPAPGNTGVPPLSEGEFSLFQRLIYTEAGIFLPPTKHFLLSRRLGKRVVELGLRSFMAYYRRVSRDGDPRERALMLDLISTNETRFFREPRHFELLEEHVLPRWKQEAAARQRGRRVRAWSAACSTGEEVYSLAMVLRDHLPPEEGWQVDLLASDISQRVVERAREAVWPMERARDIPERYLKRYMLKGTGGLRGQLAVGPKLRSLVSFLRLNLNDPSWPVAGSFDLIFCRNVLIYFDAESKARVVERCLDALAPQGLLFLGHAESLRGVTDRVGSVIPTVFQLREAEARKDVR